jgi:Family of unknown function (DUF6084)
MSVAPGPAPLKAPGPEPEFEITGGAHVRFAASPTMAFSVLATDPTGREIQSLALSVQVMIDPATRGYSDATRERLAELFGPRANWAPATQGLPWAQVAVVVPAFTEQTTFAVQVPCTYDLEVAATKYFHALEDGEVPLRFHFNGQVFYRGDDKRLQVSLIPWSRTAAFRMPVSAWRAMIEDHYPGVGWIRLSDATLRALNEYRASHGLPTFDACVSGLLQDTARGDDGDR